MPFSTQTITSVLFKKLFGKANTDAAGKDLYNESKGSILAPIAGTTPAIDFPSSPSSAALYDLTATGSTAAVEYVRLPLVADPTSNSHAFFAQLPVAYTANSSNTKKGIAPFTDSAIIVDSNGKLQLGSPAFGGVYEAKLYSGGTTAKGSGTQISAGDARMWYFDYYSGVVYQETTAGSTPSYIECFLYIGPMVSDALENGGSGGSGGAAKAPADGFQALVYDDFSVPASDPVTKVDATYTTAVYDSTNKVYTMAYSRNATISSPLTTAFTLSVAPSGLTLAANQVITVGSEIRRIVSISSQTQGVLDAAFSTSLTGAACQISQALWTVDLINYGSGASYNRLRDIFPSRTVTSVHLDYSDSDGITPRQETAALVVAAACNEGLQSDTDFPVMSLYTPFYTRPLLNSQALDYLLTANTDMQRLFLCFFPNPGSSVASPLTLVNYDCSLYTRTLLANGGFLNSAFCMSDGSGTANNCSNPYFFAGTGNTRIPLNFSFVPGMNNGSPDGDLEVLLEGQAIPRFFTGVIGTYWKEVVGYTNLIEISGDLTTTNYSIHIRRRQGSVDTSSANYLRLLTLYDAVVGTSTQVTNGAATHSSVQSAIDSVPTTGARILILAGTYTEAVTISNSYSGLVVQGKGVTTSISGNVTIQGYGCDFDNIHVSNGLWTVSGNANFIKGWADSTTTFTNSGTGNDCRVIQE